MKKRTLVIVGIVAAVILSVATIFFCNLHSAKFSLSAKYYDHAALETASNTQLQTAIADKDSFLLFVSQPECRTADDLRQVIKDLLKEYPLTIFEISSSDFDRNLINDQVRFYPSILIFKAGKLIDYLKSNDDDDVLAYTTVNGLADWLQKSINLKP